MSQLESTSQKIMSVPGYCLVIMQKLAIVVRQLFLCWV